jgi:hypothetical protein
MSRFQAFRLLVFQGFRLSSFQDFRISGFRAFGLSDFQAFRLSGFQDFRLLGFQDFRLSGFQAFRLSGFQAFRLSGFQAFRLSGFQAFRISKLQDVKISGSQDFWISGFQDFRLLNFRALGLQDFRHSGARSSGVLRSESAPPLLPLMLPVALVALLARASLPQKHAGDFFLSMCRNTQFGMVHSVSWRKRLQYRVSPLMPFSFLASLSAPLRLDFFHARWSHTRLASSRNHFFSSSELKPRAG